MVINKEFLDALKGMNPGLSAAEVAQNVGAPTNTSNWLYSTSANPANHALASSLLTGSGGALMAHGSFAQKPASQGQSVISRILDVLSRPLYAASDAAMESENALANHESLGSQLKGLGTGVIHGLSGTQKNTWNDVLQQGKDINAQKAATGDTAGYTAGEGGPLGTGEKIAGLGLNILADPLNAAKPVAWARDFGDAKGLYHIPTMGELAKKAFVKNPVPSDIVPATPIPSAPTPPASTLLNIDPNSLKGASSISDILHQKIGEPTLVAASHPHVNIDPEALANGTLKTTAPHLTPEGIQAAQELHQGQRAAFNAAWPQAKQLATLAGKSPEKAAAEYRKGIPLAKDAAKQIITNAVNELKPATAAAMEHNDKWIAEAVKNGVDPQRAVQVVKDVQAGSEFKPAFEDAVKNSQVFKGTKVSASATAAKAKTPEEFINNLRQKNVQHYVDNFDNLNPRELSRLKNDTKFRNEVEAARAGKTNNEVSSQPGTKFIKASDLTKGAKNFTLGTPGAKLSRILAPTAQEVLDGVHPSNPARGANIQAIEQAKALNGIKRAGAAAKGLSADEQAIANDAAEVARHKIMGTGGFSQTGSFNDLAQSSVWNLVRGRVASITKGGASNVRGLNERTLRIVAHVEDTLAKEGHNATSADGTPARLTDAVLNNSEFPDKLNSYPNRIINEYVNGSLVGAAAKAEQASKEAAISKPIIQSATLAVNNIFKDPALSDPVKHLLSQRTAKDVRNAIIMNTGSTRAADAGKAVFKAIQDNQAGLTQRAITESKTALTHIVTTGTIPENYNTVLNRLMGRIEETLKTDPRSLSELPTTGSAQSVLTHLLDAQAAAEGGFLGLMTTWYGQPLTRQAVVRGLNTARANAFNWSKYWHDTFSGLKQPQAIEATRAAQGLFQPVNPAVIKSAEMIRSRMENLFSSSGLTEMARQGNTVAMRGGLIRDGKYGINAELKRVGSAFRFTADKNAKNMFGEVRDFSKGTDWLNSWEVHKFGGNVPRELARIESATFNYMAKKAIFDNIARYHGVTKATDELNTAVKDIPFLKGVYFHPDVAQEIPRVARDLYGAQHSASPMLKTIDSIMRMWKTNVTIYSPSHAIHNGLGDIYNNSIAGVRPRSYAKAIKVMASARDEYNTLERLGLSVNPATDINGVAKSGERTLIKTADGQSLTPSQIKMAAHNQGILMGVQHMEDIYNTEGGIGNLNFKPFGGKVNALAHGWVQGMDHFTRLAQFIHEVEKGRGPLNEIFNSAGSTVRKYHPDGMDLTNFERTVLRRIIPFYAWTRKAIPFTIEGMLAKPGKFMVYPLTTMQLNYGKSPGINPGSQFPSDQLFPSWLSDSGIGPWGSPGGFLDKITGGGNPGEPSGYVTGSLSVPPVDLLQSYGNHPNEGILGGLNPLIKDPIELMEGHTLDSQVPIQNPGQYIADTIPAVGLASRLTNVTPLGVTPKGQQQGVGNEQNFVNFLTGLKLTNTGQYIKSAQYELHQKQTQQKKTNRDNLANFLKSVNGG